MTVPMLNSISLAHVVSLIDRMAPREVVDAALARFEIERDLLAGPPVYLPRSINAAVIEEVSRRIGDRHLGAHLGQRFRYGVFGLYAEEVLGASTLRHAVERGALTLPIVNTTSSVSIDEDGELATIRYETGIGSVMGARHIEEAVPLILRGVVRHFLGPRWHPVHVDLPRSAGRRRRALEEIYATSVQFDADCPAIALQRADLGTANPASAGRRSGMTLSELSERLGIQPPTDFAQSLREALRLQMMLGAPSAQAVANRLGLGQRLMQRRLKAEGTSFRSIRADLFREHACFLLSEAGLSVAETARALGYEETNSFRCAFETWTGQSPTAFARSKRTD